MAAMQDAWNSVSVLEPTEVAKALATSLAPMPHAMANARKIPAQKGHLNMFNAESAT
jgi:hypothetical protein